MVAPYRSAFPALLPSIAAVTLGCAPLEPLVETFEIRAHSLDQSEECAVVANPDLRIEALGPFPVSARSAEILKFRTPEQTLTFPDDTQGVTAADLESTWLGYSERRMEQGIDVLLWRERVGCTLFDWTEQADREVELPYPGTNAGQAIGYSPEAGMVLVAGGDELEGGHFGNAPQGSLVFHDGDGQGNVVPTIPTNLNFRQARAYATVTPFGSGLLLAGGENPLRMTELDQREARLTAVFFDPELGGFAEETIELELARTRQAAVELDSGETLLVGGADTGGGSMEAVTRLEAVSPNTRRTRLGAALSSERLEPVALRLSNGDVLVGGGYDTGFNPATTVEWFSPDGASEVTPGNCTALPCVELEARYHRAFVAMPGGGALTVGGCAPGTQTAACIAACGENFGCPAPTFDASWITPNGVQNPIWLEPPLAACPGVSPTTPFSPERVWLAPGSDGSPWLLAFDEDLDPPCRTAFRFEPWADVPPPPDENAMLYAGVFVAAELDLEGSWPDPRTKLASLGPDAFVWLTPTLGDTDGDNFDDPPRLAGVRISARGSLSQNETLLVADPSAPLVPLHLGPDRPPGGTVPRAPRAIYRGGRLILETENDAGPAVVVSITDTRYEDVTLTVGVRSEDGPPTVLFDRYEVGGADCAWPSGAVTPFTVARRGSAITASDGEGRSSTCNGAPTTAVTLGLRAGPTTSTITSLGVRRD
jgi:hypothetical protein